MFNAARLQARTSAMGTHAAFGFPHPTSQSPGPGSHAVAPDRYVAEVLGSLPQGDVEELLGGNAARVYGLGG